MRNTAPVVSLPTGVVDPMIALLTLIQQTQLMLQQYGEVMRCLQQSQVAILRRLDSIDRHQNPPHVLSVLNPKTDAKEYD